MTDNQTTRSETLPPGLVYSADSEPGITRRRAGRGFCYIDVTGCRIEDADERSRIDALGIPPAYEDVWICPKPNGHLQATGRDTKARKQFRYHQRWQDFRHQLKFEGLADFGEHLPRLRRRIRSDLKQNRPTKTFVLAAMARLMDRAHLRTGHENYTEDNGSYGATTLRKRHVKLQETGLKLDYRAKGGKRVRKSLSDRTLNRVLHRISDLPGRQLFRYIGEDDDLHPVHSNDINQYIQSGSHAFSAKTFRTWAASVAAFDTALKTSDELTIKAMCEAASEEIHNTPAICRSSYVHPRIIALSDLGRDERGEQLSSLNLNVGDLRQSESRLLEFLKRDT